MKKIKIRKTIIFVFFLLTTLSSCSYKSDDTMAKEEFQAVIDNILGKKHEDLKELFAYNVYSNIEGFDNQISDLISYVTGSYLSSKYTGTGAEYEIGNFKQIRFLPLAGSELYTTNSKYFFSFWYCCRDDYDKKNVGLWNLMLQKCENENDFFKPYSSYEEWTKGNEYRGITLI